MQAVISSTHPPAGHYSSAIICQGFVFLSGVLPSSPCPNDFEAEVRQALQDCRQILKQAHCDINDVVQCTAYITGVENWPAFNQVYAAFFKDHKPARTVVPVAELHHGCMVELQMTAAQPRQQKTPLPG